MSLPMTSLFFDGFMAGASHIISLPIAGRLTDEEKLMIREKYAEAWKWGTYAIIRELTSIFGAEFFKEK